MPETGEQKRQRVARNLERLKSAQRSQSEIDEYLASERVFPQLSEEPDYGIADKIGAVAQTFSDASTYGASGLLTDAADAVVSSPRTFRQTFTQNRDLRQQNKAQLSPSVRAVSEIAGAVANPVNRILPFARGGGFFKTVGKGMAEGATQAALEAGGTNAGTSSDPTGMAHAKEAAVLGGIGGGAVGVASRAIPVMQTGIRAFRGKDLGQTSKALKDTRGLLDRAQYDIADAEAATAGGTSPTLQQYLATSEDIRPYVTAIRNSKAFQNAPDYVVAQEVFKQLSTRQGELMAQTERAAVRKLGPKSIAKAEVAKKDIPLIKNELAEAIKTVAPSFDWANAGHAARMGQRKSFERAADKANAVMLGQDIAGSAMEKESPVAWMDEIDRMTPDEAKIALKGVLGRIKEIPEFTSNPVGQFGLKSSLAKTFLGPSRIQPYVEALERKAQLPPRSTAIRDLGPGIAGRLLGIANGNDR